MARGRIANALDREIGVWVRVPVPPLILMRYKMKQQNLYIDKPRGFTLLSISDKQPKNYYNKENKNDKRKQDYDFKR